MPVVVKLTPEEIEQRGLGREPKIGTQAQIRQEYDALIETVDTADMIEIMLDEGEKRSVVLWRVKSAAKRKNLVAYVRKTTADNTIVVEFKPIEERRRHRMSFESLQVHETQPANKRKASTTKQPKVSQKRAKK